MQLSDNGENFIKNKESLRLIAYPDPKWNGIKRTQSNYNEWGKPWTIGYGHTCGVKESDKISKAMAEIFFNKDIAIFVNAVNKLVKVKLTQNEYDALVSFAYNAGYGKDGLGGSTLLKMLNVGNYAGAAEQFLRWTYSGGKPSLGLKNRRTAERALFLSK